MTGNAFAPADHFLINPAGAGAAEGPDEPRRHRARSPVAGVATTPWRPVGARSHSPTARYGALAPRKRRGLPRLRRLANPFCKAEGVCRVTRKAADSLTDPERPGFAGSGRTPTGTVSAAQGADFRAFSRSLLRRQPGCTLISPASTHCIAARRCSGVSACEHNTVSLATAASGVRSAPASAPARASGWLAA
ncbi:hypothetical protein SAMN02745746_01846 [Pseudogulbenkiania subflava DSM 22618]|uniref:Uncharacterized protein n=1 Tax=Pseudogulbenkiania subflava DSM 22618 TaxID=1123014 RepID=A0A1Y6BT87_9NEIS|nr:hypothetical protein SAMN02745746_01846 [Pseudogulbenkiania subflava DSM 22618]